MGWNKSSGTLPPFQPEPIQMLINILVQVETICRIVVHDLLAVGAQFGNPWRFATGGTGFVSQLLVGDIHSPMKFCVLICEPHVLVGLLGFCDGELGVGADQCLQYCLVIGFSHSQVFKVRFHGVWSCLYREGFCPELERILQSHHGQHQIGPCRPQHFSLPSP